MYIYTHGKDILHVRIPSKLHDIIMANLRMCRCSKRERARERGTHGSFPIGLISNWARF